jgi:hypothetical protein
MYPLFDTSTMAAHAEELRRHGAAARLARCTGRAEAEARARGVRRVVGMTLVRAGLRLIEA